MSNVSFLYGIIKGFFFSLSCSESAVTLVTSERKEKVANVASFEDLMIMEKKQEKCKIKWLIGLQICTTIFTLLMVGTFYFVAYPITKEKQVLTNVTYDDSKQKENIVNPVCTGSTCPHFLL